MRGGFWLHTLPLGIAAGTCIGLTGAPLELHTLGFLGPAFLLGNLERAPRERPSARQGFVAGLVTAATTNVIALYWVVGLLETFAGFPTVASIPTATLLWVAQALSYAFAGALAGAAMARGAPGWLVLPACLVVCASLTPSLFPWRLAGTQVPWTTWVQMAELGGEPLVDLAVALVGCGAAAAALRAVRGGRWPAPAVVAAVALLVPWGYGAMRLPQVREARAEAPQLRVGVVQPNVSIVDKRDGRLALIHVRQLHEATRELEAGGAQLVVWPETAYPFSISRSRARDADGPARILGAGVRGPVLTGVITTDRERRRYNSAVAVAPDGTFLGISDKVQLLAFGEYTPLWDLLPPLQERFPRGLTPGDRPRVLEVAGARVAVLNCYEDVLPSYGLRVGRDDPHLLVNITNDAWFGDTSEPWLHQAVARMRSIETRRDLVRAVNTGVSSHTLATGADAVRTETFERAAFVADVRLMRGVTPWILLGDWVTPLLYGALLGTALGLWRRRRRRSEPGAQGTDHPAVG